MAAVPVLVVDDQAVIRILVGARLRQLGCAVSEAEDGHHALAHLESHPCALMITDLQMPGMDGQQLLHSVRERWPLIRSIVITEYATITVLFDCLRLGAIGLVPKPLNDLTRFDRAVELALGVIDAWNGNLCELQRKRPGVEPRG